MQRSQRTFKPIILLSCLFFSIKNFAQTTIDSTLIFEKARGILNAPLARYKKVPKPSLPAADKNLLPKMISYYGSKGDSVSAIFEGKIVSIQDIGGVYLLMTSFGKYSIGYSGLVKPALKEGTYIKKGQFISRLTTCFGIAYLTVQFYKDNMEVDPEEWIKP